MKIFIKYLIIFQIPLACVFGIIAISGELLNYDIIIAYQNKHNALLGLAYSNPIREIKLLTTEYKNPKIITLGTSRVMQFRGFFFNEPESFYNAGGGIVNINDFNNFINTLHVDKLEIIIIGLDQDFFNENRDNISGSPFNYRKNFSFINIFRKQKVLEDLYKGKIDIKRLLTSNNIGLTARIHNEGFRSDGSYYYARTINNPKLSADIIFKDTFDRIRNGNKRFEYCQNIHYAAVQELDSFLQNCKKKNIYVVAFLPPFADAVWNKLKLRESDYRYMFDLYKELKPIFTSYSFELFDFSDIAGLGATDAETIDGFHGSEVAYLRLLIKMTEESETMKHYVNLNSLNDMLSKAVSSKEIKREIP